MITRLLSIAFTLFFFSINAQQTTFKTNGPDDFREGLFAFTNATIFKDYQTKIEHATLIIKQGKVVEINTTGAIPTGAIVEDATDKYIYPSFIELFADYGMPETPKRLHSEEPQYESNIKGAYGWNQAIKSDFDAAKNFLVQQNKADEWRKMGFGAVLSHKKDGICRGSSCLVSLANEKENKVLLKPTVASFFSFNKGSSTQEYPSSLMGSVALLRQTFLDANWYKNQTNPREQNISLEAFNSLQKLPSIFDATNFENCFRAQKIGKEFNQEFIYKTNGKEYQRIEELKNLHAKLITSISFPKAYNVDDPFKSSWVTTAEMQHWELAPANLTFLEKAEIQFAISSSDLKKEEDFLKNLRLTLRYGISESNVLKALTFTPANYINCYSQIGSLEKEKWANFLVCSKNIFEDGAQIEENWTLGIKNEITKSAPKDIRGEYDLVVCEVGKDCAQIPLHLKITGEKSTPKATIFLSDSNKIDVKLDYKNTDISLQYNLETKKTQNKYLLAGWIDFNKKIWQGKGVQPNGNEVTWIAIQTKAAPLDSIKPAKKDTLKIENLAKINFPFSAYGNSILPTEEKVIFKNATLWTNEEDGILKNADLIIRNGKIDKIGKNLNCKECKEIDATNKHVTSGIIDEHSHLAIANGVNEGSKAISAEVRIGDVINSEDVNIYRQLAGGVVAAQLLHGSANPIGGQSALIKLRWGYMPEKMKIEGADGFIKFALGENVKQSNWGQAFSIRYPQTRMGVEQTYINYFTKAKEYEKLIEQNKNARRDLELEALVEILNKKRFITCHSYIQSEINMLMHVADSFHFKVNTFTHILEGYKVADKMKLHGVNASTFADWWAYKYEVIDAIPQNATILTRMGINTAINSDDAEMARRLNQEAAKSIKYGGMSEEDAWKMVTLNPAKMLHLDKKMGSLATGKDADVVLWNANPLSVYARVEKTFVDGICFYDEAKDVAKKTENKKERARLIQKMLDDKKAGNPTQEPTKTSHKEYSCGEEEEHN